MSILATKTPLSLNQNQDHLVKGSTSFSVADSSYISKTFSSAGNRRNFTVSWWSKTNRVSGGGQSQLLTAGASGSELFQLSLEGNAKINFECTAGGSTSARFYTQQTFRDPSAWTHFLLYINTAHTTNTERMKFYINGSQVTDYDTDIVAVTYPTENMKFYWMNSQEHNVGKRTYSSTYSDFEIAELYCIDGQPCDPTAFGFTDPKSGIWVPKKFDVNDICTLNDGTTWSSQLSGTAQGSETHAEMFDDIINPADGGAADVGYCMPDYGQTITWTLPTGGITAKTDRGIWMWMRREESGSSSAATVTANGVDITSTVTSQVSANNQGWVKIKDKGEVLTAFTFNNTGADAYNFFAYRVGAVSVDGCILKDGLGSAATAGWGTNGFYLPMDGTGFTSSTLGNATNLIEDQSPNKSNWTANNTPIWSLDSPSGCRNSINNNVGVTTTNFPGSYCTMSGYDYYDGLTLSHGNLKVTSTSGDRHVRATHRMPSTGKWYWECLATTVASNSYLGIGVYYRTGSLTAAAIATAQGRYVTASGYKGGKGGATSSYGGGFDDGDLIMVAVNMDEGTIFTGKNGAWFDSADPVTNANPMYSDLRYAYDDMDWYPCCNNWQSGNTSEFNFGQKPFAYAPPKDFLPLCSQNMPVPGSVSPDKYFSANIWTGNETAGRIITTGFNPDLIVGKARNDTGNWYWTDSVRGSNKFVYSNDMSEETTTANIINIDDNTPDGFKLGSSGVINGTSAYNYVSYSWKAGGSKNSFNVDDVGHASSSDVGMNSGALNSTTINATQVWSGLFTLASGSFDQAIANAFNGYMSESTRARTSGNQVLITMTLSTPVTVSSSVKVIGETGYESTCTITVGGTTHTSSVGDSHTFYVSGSLTQMTLTGNSASGRTYMEGMFIDGKELVDSDITYNRPSIAATGASVGTKHGFSIIKYTGTGAIGSIAHGLGKKPAFWLIRNLDNTGGSLDFPLYHDWLGPQKYMRFNSNVEAITKSSIWNDTRPDSGVLTIGSDSDCNIDGEDYIAWVWANVEGVQHFGAYQGNGSTTGPMVWTGFKPAMVIIKRTTSGSTNDFVLFDNKRDLVDPCHHRLIPDTNGAENDTSSTSVNRIDFLSTGFKIWNSGDAWNNSGSDYIYMAWAANPFASLYGVSSTTRDGA